MQRDDRARPTRYREAFFILLGVALLIWLVWLGSRPLQTQALSGDVRHYAAHFAAFGALAVTWSCGLPRVRAVPLALAIVAFGFAHEALEIFGHAHGYELIDAIVDGVGATLGVAVTRLARW
jgi:hypothetical protein